MFKLLGAWLLEAEDLAAFRIDPGHDVAYGSVFSGSIHALEYQEQRLAMRRVMKLLQRTQLLQVVKQNFLVLLRRIVKGVDNRRPLVEVDFLVWRHAIVFRIDDHNFHSVPQVFSVWRLTSGLVRDNVQRSQNVGQCQPYSRDVEAGKEWNLYRVQEQSKCNCGDELAGDHGEGQGSHGDSANRQRRDDENIRYGR